MIALRPAWPEDAAAIAAIYAPHVEGSIVSFETEAPGPHVIAERMKGADGLYPWIVAVADEAVLGYAYAGRFREREAYRWVVETTVYVADTAHRRGVGRALYAELLANLSAQGFTEAMGVIALPNEGSVALHEAMGFRLAGMFPRVGYKYGQWIDVGYWQRGLAEPQVPAAEPRRFSAAI